MNNTPETNSRAWSDHSEGILHEVVEANFARKLEREREEAREKAERYRLEANSLMLQRDELRELLESEKITRNHIIKRSVEVERERDEAREKAERYRIEANAMMMQRDEARESLKHIGEYGTEEINAAIDLRQKLASALVERDDAQKELSSIYRWIERNHADGFIDSLTYLKNLERVMDCWYDRLDKIERERDEAREALSKIDEIFCDGEDTHDDWMKMGIIAKDYLKGLE